MTQDACPSCGGPGAEAYRPEVFRYGSDVDGVDIHVRVPVFTCAACGESFTDHRGEAIRDRAVKRMLKMRQVMNAMGRPDEPCPVCSVPLPADFFAHGEGETMGKAAESLAFLIDHFIGKGATPQAMAEALSNEAARLLIDEGGYS